LSETISPEAYQDIVFKDRYSLKDAGGKPLEDSWGQAADRMARAVAVEEDEKYYEDYRTMLRDMYFLPGGRAIAVLGTGYALSPYNCFVLPSPEDNIEGIFDSLYRWAKIQARGGGVGINLSSLRPNGSRVVKVNGTSSGVVPWGELFSTVTHKTIQQGGTRRGAGMLMLDISHPDVEEFIDAKRVYSALLGANLSVNVSDSFMDALREDKDWDLHFGGKVYKTLPARELWDKITSAAWASGEPGVVFLDRCNQWSNSHYFEQLIATNPCAEQPGGPYAVCALGSVNLVKHRTPADIFDTMLLATRFTDKITDLAYSPFPEIEESQKSIRRMGIGVVGLADYLIQNGYKYDTKEARGFAEEAYKNLAYGAYTGSILLAREKGHFPAYRAGDFLRGKFVGQLPRELTSGIEEHGIRNCFLTSQAPTGTLHKLARVFGSGIEPIYAKDIYINNRLGQFKLEVPDSEYLRLSENISPRAHVDMMATVQKYVDSAISKTVNAPSGHSLGDTKEVYDYAWKAGCKSIAYYRDTSRPEQVLSGEEESEGVPSQGEEGKGTEVRVPAARGTEDSCPTCEVGDRGCGNGDDLSY
jgi:ribonucleoside-diphosphate reductase alpha chain